MILEGLCDFGVPAITNSTAATVSPNVFDAGSAVKLFGNLGTELAIIGHAVCTADDNPTLRVDLVGSDVDVSLAGNNDLEYIATMYSVYKPDGTTAWASGDDIPIRMRVNYQRVAKRYYGLLFTLGGTNPDTTGTAGGAGRASLVVDSQSNDYRAAAATP